MQFLIANETPEKHITPFGTTVQIRILNPVVAESSEKANYIWVRYQTSARMQLFNASATPEKQKMSATPAKHSENATFEMPVKRLKSRTHYSTSVKTQILIVNAARSQREGKKR